MCVKKDNSVYKFIVQLKNLELKTDAGKINYRYGMLLIILIAFLTSFSWVLKGISMIVGAIKSFILKENIIEPYEEADAPLLILITIAFFILCFTVLFISNKSKEKLRRQINEINKENEANKEKAEIVNIQEVKKGENGLPEDDKLDK